MMKRIPSGFSVDHSPDAILDYGLSWASWLAESEQIISSTWTADTGITLSTPSYTTTSAKVFVAGGVEGVIYKLKNSITTNQGRAESKLILISCKHH